MARQPTLAEILADDTGRIRPEVADWLMEPPPPRPRPRLQQGPVPRLQPRPRPGGAPVAPPRRFGPGWIIFSLILFVVILALIASKDRGPDKKISRLNNYQSSKETTTVVNLKKELSPPPMVKEKNEKDQSTQNPLAETAPLDQRQEEPCKNWEGRRSPHLITDPIVPRAESWERRPRREERITQRQPQEWYAYHPKPSKKNKRDSIKIYIVTYPECRERYSRNRSRITPYQNPGARIVVRGRMPFVIDSRLHQRSHCPYVRERIEPRGIGHYYNFIPPPAIYRYQDFAFANRKVTNPYWRW